MITDNGALIAVVANQIIQARHRLDTRQQKVIMWAIAQIARDDSELDTHTLSVTEFARLIGSESGSVFREMEGVTSSLLQEVLHIRINDGDRQRVKFQWLSECVYRDGEGTVTIKFHDRLKPYLTELRSRFTQLRLDKFFTFRSTYTIRFFERIEMQRGMNRLSWRMTLDEMREWLGLDHDAYEAFSALKAYVLQRAQTELDTRSDWSFSFQTIKVGRKITGVEFTLRPARIKDSKESGSSTWDKLKPDIKKQVLSMAHAQQSRYQKYEVDSPTRADQFRTVWGEAGRDATDSEIIADHVFHSQVLPYILEEIERGQKHLKLL